MIELFNFNKILLLNAQSISKIYHEVFLFLKFLQTKPQAMSMNNENYDLFYTVIKNRDDKEVVNDEYENAYINFKDIITPNHYIGIQNDNELLR